MQNEVFICYSRRDLDAVMSIKQELEANGLSCWMDIDGIESGEENFKRKIVPALDNCCTVLFFISEHSQKSEWTDKELGYARRHGKRIVPLRFNEDPLWGVFDLDFGNANIIDWRKPEQKARLLHDLAEWKGAGVQVEKTESGIAKEKRTKESEQEEAEEAFLAMARRFKRDDGRIDEEERKLLDSTAHELGISNAQKILLIERIEAEFVAAGTLTTEDKLANYFKTRVSWIAFSVVRLFIYILVSFLVLYLGLILCGEDHFILSLFNVFVLATAILGLVSKKGRFRSRTSCWAWMLMGALLSLGRLFAGVGLLSTLFIILGIVVVIKRDGVPSST